MALCYIVFSPLLSFVIRLVLARGLLWTLAENILLIMVIKHADVSWATSLVVLVIFISFAFLQTQSEYVDSVQAIDSRRAPLECPAGYWNSGCPAYSLRRQAKEPDYHIPAESPVQNKDKSLQANKGLHGRLTLFPCNLRHRRMSYFRYRFDDSYLYVGCPVGLRACYSPLITVEPSIQTGSWLSIKKAWFSIRPEDHAFNGGADLTMAQKLEEFLTSQVGSRR